MVYGNMRRIWWVLPGLLVLSGCGSGLPFDAAKVTGKVTYQGRPLDHGQVIFVPDDGTPGPHAVGVIQPDGSFEMRSGSVSGVAVGSHRVTVFCQGELTEKEKLALVLPKSLIPEIYGRPDTTPLSCEVKKGEDREYNITLE